MFRNYLAAALNNLSRNRLYAAISIVGLAIGMAAAILTGLYIRDELTFDHFIPGHENVYVLISRTTRPGEPVQIADGTIPQIAGWLKLDFPEVKAVARTLPVGRPSVRRGEIEAVEETAWVDGTFFTLLPLPLVSGDLKSAAAQSDSVVISRSMARKYFGADAPVGQTLELERGKPFRVAAVIKDLPSSSHLTTGIFAYSKDPAHSDLAKCDVRPYRRGDVGFCGRTYVRFANARDVEQVRKALPDFVRRHIAPEPGPAAEGWKTGISYSLDLVALDALHFSPQTISQIAGENRVANRSTLYALGAIALLILLVAGVNFVNLMTARATRRAVEVGVRKACGAEQRHLVAQFIGESLIYAALGVVLAAVLVELLLPSMNAALQRTIMFDYWRDPRLILAIVGLALAMGLLAGVYPALVLSGFAPAAVLKAGAPAGVGSAAIREGLVVVQFAILIGLILATAVIYRQTRFALGEGLRLDTDQMLVVDMQCTETFAQRIKAVPGVRGAACSGQTEAVLAPAGGLAVKRPGRPDLELAVSPIDYGFLEIYGIHPLAGRLFTPDHPADTMPRPPETATTFTPPQTILINLSAARELGFSKPAQAVGAAVRFNIAPGAAPASQIVGVVPDFTIDLLRGPIKPAVYLIFPPAMSSLNVKLTGQAIPETLAAIERVWKQSGEPRALHRRFVNQYLQALYLGAIREGILVGALAAIAVFIACLGLFGLAAFTAERRTKEIGVRKAMGASRTDIVRLLLWQFTKPVLWASLIAWPLAWLVMDHWLHGFTDRIALQPWLFLAAAAGALLIAWATVFVHALGVARARPVRALRYE